MVETAVRESLVRNNDGERKKLSPGGRIGRKVGVRGSLRIAGGLTLNGKDSYVAGSEAR